jgi:hypothetical protein
MDERTDRRADGQRERKIDMTKLIVVFPISRTRLKTSENIPHGGGNVLFYTHYQARRHERDQNSDRVIEIINMSERSVVRESKTRETVRTRHGICGSQSRLTLQCKGMHKRIFINSWKIGIWK